MQPTITQEQLKSILRYEPDTGDFYWLVDRSKAVKAGMRAGCRKVNGRAYITIKKVSYLAYRLAWLYVTGALPKESIDHIDGDTANDRFSNLRDVSMRVNNENQRGAASHSTSGLLGASPSRKRWRAVIRARRKNYCLGTFDTPEQAHAAYVAAKRQLHEGCTL